MTHEAYKIDHVLQLGGSEASGILFSPSINKHAHLQARSRAPLWSPQDTHLLEASLFPTTLSEEVITKSNNLGTRVPACPRTCPRVCVCVPRLYDRYYSKWLISHLS